MGELAGFEGPWNDASATMAEQPLSFEDLFHSERDRLFRVLCVIVGSRQEAEDVSQDAFARVWERWANVSLMAKPAGYLHRTAMNLFRSRYRRALLAARRSLSARAEDDAFEAVDDRQVALHVPWSMAPRQRAAIVLTEILGFTAEEAGRSSRFALRPSARCTSRRDRRSRATGRQAMPELGDLLERELRMIRAAEFELVDVQRLRQRRQRNGRVGSITLALVVSVLATWVLVRAFANVQHKVPGAKPPTGTIVFSRQLADSDRDFLFTVGLRETKPWPKRFARAAGYSYEIVELASREVRSKGGGDGLSTNHTHEGIGGAVKRVLSVAAIVETTSGPIGGP